MSTIWTPGGEYVPREEPPKQPAAPPPGQGREPTPEEMQAALAEARRAAADQRVTWSGVPLAIRATVSAVV